MTDEPLIQFVAKNLSWGIFQAEVSNGASVLPQAFFDHYLESLERYHVNCTSPNLMLYTIIELIGSTSYSCILKQTPVSMEEYMPYLHETLKKIIEVFTVKEDAE